MIFTMRLLTTIFAAAAVIALAPAALADPLAGITVAPEVNVEEGSEHEYKRSLYRHWDDVDRDCQEVRHEVLIDESLVPVTFKDKEGEEEDVCDVETGLWFDPYTGLTFANASDLDVDHVVPLKEAHESGAHLWAPEKRRLYANDRTNPGHLLAVDDSTNQSKKDRDPAEWMPPNEGFHCAYVTMWSAIKLRWELSMDQAEADAIRTVLTGC